MIAATTLPLNSPPVLRLRPLKLGYSNLKNATVNGNILRGALVGWFSVSPLSGTIRFTNNSILGASVGVSLGGTMTDLDLILQGNTLADTSGVAINITTPVDGCTTAFVTSGATDPSYITDNEVAGSTAAWGKSGSYGELYYGRNRTNVDVAFAIRNLTIASGAITVFMDFHYVTVESGTAADLTQING